MKKNQYDMPLMGFGTFGRNGEEGIEAILTALEVGYRHIDTAQTYDTEAECGEAIRRSGVNRTDIFVTTKISTDNFGPGQLVPSLKRSLDQLGMDQVDLTLIHWPSPHGKVPLNVYMEQLAEAHAEGLTARVGVSNFTIALLAQAQEIMGDLKLVNNQFENHPYLQNALLTEYCKRNDISVTCYLPIARNAIADDPVLQRVARAHDCTVQQAALAFSMARGLCVIPASANPDRIATNFAAQQIELTDAEVATIAAIDRNERQIDFDWAPDWD